MRGAATRHEGVSTVLDNLEAGLSPAEIVGEYPPSVSTTSWRPRPTRLTSLTKN
jgi:hypothetical protein